MRAGSEIKMETPHPRVISAADPRIHPCLARSTRESSLLEMELWPKADDWDEATYHDSSVVVFVVIVMTGRDSLAFVTTTTTTIVWV